MPAKKNDPDRARLMANFRDLPAKSQATFVMEALTELGAAGIVIDGANGELESLAFDRTLAPKYLKNRTWSADLLCLINAALAGGGTYVDLGANIGAMTVPVVRRPNVLGIAVEPDPDNLRVLRRNLARNGVAERVTVHHAAIVGAPGEVAFELSPRNPGDHRIHPNSADPDGDRYGEAGRHITTVPGRTLDELIDARALEPPIVVKMDIQGAEPHAFAAGKALLAQAALVVIEYWPYGMRRLALDIDAFHSDMATLFRYGAIVPDREPPVAPALAPIADLTAQLAEVSRDDPIEAIDVVLTNDPVLAWLEN